jgi:hypothetical protein
MKEMTTPKMKIPIDAIFKMLAYKKRQQNFFSIAVLMLFDPEDSRIDLCSSGTSSIFYIF